MAAARTSSRVEPGDSPPAGDAVLDLFGEALFDLSPVDFALGLLVASAILSLRVLMDLGTKMVSSRQAVRTRGRSQLVPQ